MVELGCTKRLDPPHIEDIVAGCRFTALHDKATNGATLA